MNPAKNLERYLPFGYAFLVIMGIIKESVKFYQLGINILDFSSITDILMSPIATLTMHPLIFCVVMITMTFGYYYPIFIQKHLHKKWVQKSINLKNMENMSSAEVNDFLSKKSVQLATTLVLSMFLGLGFGQGMITKEQILNDEFKYRNTLTYSSGENEEIALIHSNSQYYFYLPKGSKKIQITPISSIKQLEVTKNRMLD